MSYEKFTFDALKGSSLASLREDDIEYGFIGTLQKLKYEYRPEITNRATLEANYREKFEALNRVRLTSFKTATLLKENEHIHKCVFVVDRKDLDRQTREEFNRFQEGRVVENTKTAFRFERMRSIYHGH